MTGQAVRIPGRLRLHCLLAGDVAAQLVVLLHALGERASDWTYLIDRLSAHYRVVAPDLRGHGDSESFARESVARERPPGPLPFDWPVVTAIAGEVNDPTHRWWPGLSTITASTLIVGGGPTSHIPQERLREAAELVPDCTLVTIPVGHCVHANRPEEFADLVLDWLAGNNSP